MLLYWIERNVVQGVGVGTAHPINAPGKSQNRGCNAEGKNVGERVQLCAEFCACSGQPRHSAVQAVQDITDADRDGRLIILAVECGHHRVVRTENVTDCKKTWENRE